ncbi:MAG: S-adenosylmethionine decarboxylase [Clostridiales bacterium]|nr:S-adenosylmethionine decarboxylase [Clostridiales bacterium]
MPHLHFMMDAYGSIEEHANNLMAVNELLNNVALSLKLKPVMPPFLVPYYYCEDAEDGGISAFLICEGGHITIHTFPYRSCYFVDILSDEFFSASAAEAIFKKQLYAERITSKLIDRRTIYNMTVDGIDKKIDFGPHYMIEVNGVEMTVDWIFKWLDQIAEKIKMVPITRPYVIYDRKDNPSYISGLLVVAQSHIAVHYDVQTKQALIDIFSCTFLDDNVIHRILDSYFGDNYSIKLFSRGSKHTDIYKRKQARISASRKWRDNI